MGKIDQNCKILQILQIFLLLFRGLAFIFLFPIVQILCFLYAVGGDIRGIKLAVVNDETMTYACNRSDFTGTAIPYSFSSCHFTEMGCRFLKHLDDHPMMTLVSRNESHFLTGCLSSLLHT